MPPLTRLLAVLVLILIAAPAPLLAAPQTQVRVEQGLLRGVAGPDAVAFKGVPYALPPVGELRWAPPHKPSPWPGLRDASSFGPVCPQAPDPNRPEAAPYSEDCLTLNVWTPLDHGRPAPVIVWIHGGGDESGAASRPEFDGASFARDGVVFVSIEYRLGVLGWFAHPALTRAAAKDAPLGSYGLMDQIAALQWVQRNIAAFGGDPANVTVAGESAGGESILFLLTTPAARGLFSRAIVESGTGWARYPTLAKAETLGETWAARAGAPGRADLKALRALPVQALLAARGDDDIGPILDGRLLGASPEALIAAGQAVHVPLLIGSNSGEDNLLGGNASFIRAQIGQLPPGKVDALRAAYGEEGKDDLTFGRDLFRDQLMGAPARWVAAHWTGAPAYLYRFDYVPMIRRLRVQRAGHGSEMLFVFESLNRAPVPIRRIADEDVAEEHLLHGCWVAFARTGVPACPGAPPWPAYDPVTAALMRFADQPTVEPRFNAAAYDLEDQIEAERTAKRAAP